MQHKWLSLYHHKQLLDRCSNTRYLPSFITSQARVTVQLKGTSSARRQKGTLSKEKIAIAGGAVACALVLVVVINAWNSDTIQNGVEGGNPAPVASGTGEDIPSSSGLQSDSVGGPESIPSPVSSDGEDASQGSEDTPIEPVIFHFTDDNFDTLRSDPDGYVNSTVAISGRVYEIIDQSAGGYTLVTFRIHNQAIDSDDSRAAVMYQEARSTKSVPLDIAVDDCITVNGTVRGGIGDTNALGQDIRIPVIDSTSVAEIECIDSAMPASTTIDSNLTQSYGGVTLAAERVQLADGHLRVKIVAQNVEVTDTVFVREKESHAEYLGNDYQSINHLPAYSVYKLDSAIPPQSEIEGYLFFEPVPEFSGGTFTFRIVVEKVGISESVKSTFILRI